MIIDLVQLKEVTNSSFWPLFEDRSRYLVLWGGAGSGKSYFAAEKILLRIIKSMEGGYNEKFLCLRKTKPAARKSIFTLFKSYITKWNMTKLCTIRESTMEIHFRGGSQIIIGGMDDPEKIKSIEGVSGIWMEEASEFTMNDKVKDFTQLDLRLRGETHTYKQIIVSFNPISELNWTKKRFFDTPEPDATLHHSTYIDNRFLDKKYIEVLEKLSETDANYHRIYKEGNWGVLEGLVYGRWEETNVWPEHREFDTFCYGLDFGFSNNPATLIDVGFKGDDLYLRERFYETKLTNQDICNKLENIRDGVPIIADSAEPKSIQEINNAGYLCIGAAKGPDSVKFGIQRVKQFNMKVDAFSTNIKKELVSYRWAVKANGEPVSPPKPEDKNNHAMDAMRYAVVKLKGLGKGKISIYGEDDKESRKEHMREVVRVRESDEELGNILEELER
jgi:phage terminase large subunit